MAKLDKPAILEAVAKLHREAVRKPLDHGWAHMTQGTASIIVDALEAYLAEREGKADG